LTTAINVVGWQTHGPVLASFRPGNYPSGLDASQWLDLAQVVAELARLDAMTDRSVRWQSGANGQLRAAEEILCDFKRDPPVLGFVIRTAASRHRKALVVCALGLIALGLAAIALASR
jgi:hypothetical protein